MPKPETICQAVREILNSPDAAALKEEGAPTKFHHFTGRWIRNNWGLWDNKSKLHKAFNEIGIHHPDDMSGIIMETAHRILNGKRVNLAGQIAATQKYWADYRRPMEGTYSIDEKD